MSRVSAIQTFQFAQPEFAGPRAVVELCRGDSFGGEVQVLRPGAGLDAGGAAEELWFVVRGRSRFLGQRQTLVGQFGAGDGFLLPASASVRVESVGPDDLAALRLGGPLMVEPGDVPRLSGRIL
jgi:mannose-6-phosphate isomerase-like protein (cupin superfamily)